jgi:hypothetical protein
VEEEVGKLEEKLIRHGKVWPARLKLGMRRRRREGSRKVRKLEKK